MTMSNQCSNLCNHRSFSFGTPFLTPLKPYATILRPFFPFQHNLILIGRRSRNRSSSLHLTQAAQSSSDIVLVATTEHHDGSLVFQFGDASEIVESDDVVGETASQTEEGNSVVKVLDGDQDTHMSVKTGNDSVEGRLIEVADGIRNVDFDTDIVESETDVIRDLSNNYAESVSESKLDEEKISDPTFDFCDNNPNIEQSADSEETLLKCNDDTTADPLVSMELESKQASQTDDLEKIEIEDTRKTDTEDIVTMNISDIKLTDAANEDVEEESKDVMINESSLIDELPPSDIQLMGAENEDVEDSDIVIEEMSSLVDQLQSVEDGNVDEEDAIKSQSTIPLEVKPPVEVVNMSELEDTISQNLDDGDDNEIKDSVKLETIQVSDNEETDSTQPHNEDSNEGCTKDPPAIIHASFVEKLQDINITLKDEMPTSDPLGAELCFEASTTKDMDVKDIDEQLQDVNITFIDEMSKSDSLGAEPTFEVSASECVDVDMNEKLQDVNATFIDEMPIQSEPTCEVSTNKGMDVDDMNTSEDIFLDEISSSDSLEVSATDGMDIKNLAVEGELQLVSNDENEIADVIPAEAVLENPMQVSHMKVDNLDDEVIDEDAGDSYIEDEEHELESEPVEDEGNMSEQCAESDAVVSSILVKEGAERSEGVVVGNREDFLLLSGAVLLDHPSKALTGGDDAYFVAGSKWLGVANAVSQWSFEGSDPGVYAQELMRSCEAIVLMDHTDVSNPIELLCRGVKQTNMSGSANVLIASFSGQALHVANIGDTGFMIIRHGAIYKKSSPLLHEFHFALQLQDSDDPLQLVEEHVIELERGDVVVSATDGLFDNLYEREISMIVSKSLEARMKPQEIANILARRAEEVGKSAFVRSPFSDAAQAAGYTGYAGGKPDNVAVIVSLLAPSQSKQHHESMEVKGS